MRYLYQNFNFVRPRNSKILYYDCANYYFKIEAEDGMKKYGNRKNSTISKIVQYRCNNQNSHTTDKHWGYGCFWIYKVSKMGI